MRESLTRTLNKKKKKIENFVKSRYSRAALVIIKKLIYKLWTQIILGLHGLSSGIIIIYKLFIYGYTKFNLSIE